MKKHCEIKFVFVLQNVNIIVYNAIKKKLTHSVSYQSRIIEDNLIYLNSQIKLLDKRDYKIIDYLRFIDNPIDHLLVLSEWFGISYNKMNRFNVIKKIKKEKDIPSNYLNYLKKFFNEDRKKQWNDLYNNENIIKVKEYDYDKEKVEVI